LKLISRNCHLKITIISNNNGKSISLDMISRDKKFQLDDNIIENITLNSEIDFLIKK